MKKYLIYVFLQSSQYTSRTIRDIKKCNIIKIIGNLIHFKIKYIKNVNISKG